MTVPLATQAAEQAGEACTRLCFSAHMRSLKTLGQPRYIRRMKEKMFAKHITAILILLTATASISAADNPVKVSLYPNPAIAGEPVQLRMVSDSDYPVISDLPKIENVSWMDGSNTSLSTSIINYKKTVHAENTYTLVPEKAGTYTIPSLTLSVGEKKFRTEPIEFKVHERKFRIAQDEEGKSGKDSGTAKLDDLIFAKILPLSDKKSFYIGEEINFEFRIYKYHELNMQITWPAASSDGNVIFRDYSKANKESPNFGEPRQFREEIKGRLFDVYAFPSAFRSITDGQVNLSVTDECQIRIPRQRRKSLDDDDDFFGMMDPFNRFKTINRKVGAQLKKLEIKPLPPHDGKTLFTGLTGEWKIKIELSKPPYKSGEPITLTLNIYGNGTTETLKAPELKLENFRMYPPEVEKSENAASAVQKAVIRYILIPLQEGQEKISVDFSTFSTEKGKYETVKFSKELKIEKGEGASSQIQIYADSGTAAAQGAAPSAQMPQGAQKKSMNTIFYLKKNEDSSLEVPLWKNNIALVIFLFLGAPLALFINELRMARKARFNSDPLLRRKIDAEARKGKMLKKIASSGDDGLEHVVLSEVVPYLNDIKGLPPGTSASELVEKIDDEAIAESLRSAGHMRYMPGASNMNKEDMKKKLLAALKTYTAIAIFFFAGFSSSAGEAQKAAANPDEAFTAYDKGELEKAAEFFKSKINPSALSPAMLYDLGNCYTRQGKYPKALLCYERALRLSPRDSDIQENLNFVKRRLFLPVAGPAQNPQELIATVRDSLRPDNWLMLTALCWAACGAVLLFRKKLNRYRLAVALAVPVAGIIIAVTAILSQYSETYNSANAVIVQKSTPLYVLPSENSETSDIPLKGGECVKIIEQRLDWARVRSGNAEGWIPSHAMTRLWGDWNGFLKGD